MPRIHDLGSVHGFEPQANLAKEDPPFEYDWQAHMFAVHRLMAKKGVYALDEFRDAIETLPPAEYLKLGYYERWLAAIPPLVLRKSNISVEIPETFDD
ncbi:SH3-like domain-containing protein [Arthrobacter sp. B6]|uniref:SH3-like domain-containing protein n=1 Tax=Arthrobacter sp. B6 TaxID=1570137 RepID=UPI00082A62AC|nr:SH3-like domain-containing protein [Arthrobacter sp. B6]